MNQTPKDSCLILKSKLEFKAEEFNYELSQNNTDIGKILKELNIKPYQRINIELKKGIYEWNEYYVMPEKSYISLVGEECKDGGKDNKVTIIINNETECERYGVKYSNPVKLSISEDSTAKIIGIDFIEQIVKTKSNDPRLMGIIELRGDNSRLYFAQTITQLSNSPFIHIAGWTLGRIIFGYSHFHKNPKSKEKNKISLLSTARGWGWGGSRAIVSLPKDYYTPNEECFFDKENNNIEFIY